ncbi:MAG: hypothetical protein C7B45_07095 [Sulfobacillus acidophilus]|uniref:Inositol 2-dehydrogenase n=1 Tax=Sulfobacillus acidophilus TaxID=53633 RepID=A0A2T2WJF2_9FIRM|nr:MAG: hypothetical protein C7B45_07095 [Sulfobacillus acidophilus]
MTSHVRIGVIGVGGMGRTHAWNLNGAVPGAQLVGVADPRIDTIDRDALPPVPRYQDYRQLLESDLDAIVIAAASTAHAEVLKAAVSFQHPVFCEKPLALTLEDSVAIHRLYESLKVPLQMGFMRRFDPQYRRAFDLIQEGAIGTPYHYSGISRDRVGPALEVMRYSGGFYLDTGVHEFDIARWLLHSEITSVFARGGIYNHPEYETVNDVDQAHVSFQCESGAMGLVELSRDAVYGYEIRTEVLGTRGAVQVVQVNATGTALLVDGEVRRDTYRDYAERFREAYFHEMQGFVEMVRTGGKPSVGSVDGIRATVVAQAAQRSLLSHRDETVVNPV